ncbi:MAG: hypothetical protein WA324_30335 [Bryobacteraceae bacterium]
MLESKLRPSTQIVAAEWLAPRLRSFGSAVAAVVPDDFPAYVRILHPARGVKDEPITWAEVAARSGSTMHRLVQFHAIARSDPFGSGRPSPFGIEPPDSGNLPANLLISLCAVLPEHTSTEDSCWFCLWDGYGWIYGNPAVSAIVSTPLEDTSGIAGPVSIPPGLPSEVLQGNKVTLPHRNYFLFNGPLRAAGELGCTTPWGSFDPQSPNLFWPQDHAWCVATEIDLFCTFIGGSEKLAEALLVDSRFEAWRVFPGDPITWDSDDINT